MSTCPICSAEVTQEAVVCPSCGRPLEGHGNSPRAGIKISGLAIRSLFLSITALFFPIVVLCLIHLNPAASNYLDDSFKGPERLGTILSLISILIAAAGIRAAWKARKQIKASGSTLKGVGRAWTGLGMGFLGLILYGASFLLLVDFAFGSGCILRSRLGVRQASAVGSLRTVHSSAETYRMTYHRGFPMYLVSLGPPKSGYPPNAGGADLVDEILASGTKASYVFNYQVTKRDEKDFPTGYAITASPLEGCGTGNGNCYFTDETGVIRMDPSRLPDQRSSPLAG